MLKTKRILLLLFAVLSLLVMASCGGTKSCDECVDGDGEDEYFIGTNHTEQTETATFKFG